MAHGSEIRTRGAEAQTGLRLQGADHLPAWLSLWGPLAIAAALALIWNLAPQFYFGYIAYEDGVLEASHFIVALICVVWCLRVLALPEVRRDRLVLTWIVLGLFGSFYIAGEEISWGQQYVHWVTPDSWQSVNDQGETNLHNTSAWLDQKPRTLLEIGVIVGGIVIPLLALRWPWLRKGRFALFLPALSCLPVAVICEVVKMSGRLQSIGFLDWKLFENASEVQELYLSLFILLYLVVFRNRVLARRSAGLPARPVGG